MGRRRRFPKDQSKIVRRVRTTLGQAMSPEEVEHGALRTTRRIRNTHDREDAMQEYRIAAWLATGSVDPAGNPKAYQSTCGRHAVIDYCRRTYRHQPTLSLHAPVSGSPDLSLAETLPASEKSPYRLTQSKDFMEHILCLIRALPSRLRAVLELVIQGHNSREISRRLGHSRQAINRRRKEASQILLRALANQRDSA